MVTVSLLEYHKKLGHLILGGKSENSTIEMLYLYKKWIENVIIILT